MRVATIVLLSILVGCASAPSGPAITFDPCAATAVDATSATSDQTGSLDDAIAMWRTLDVGLARDARDPAIAVEFRDAADAVYGFYDDATATVYINERVVDRAPRAIAIAHELGHALGLVHVTTRDSVMNPGNLAIAPNAEDATALAAIWGRCPR